ncbi:MAG: ATP-binding SpoIIE family protein phosphatase [Pseudomonadota bacterium]
MNKLGRQSAFHIGELSEIASARRAGNDLARQLGFDETRTGQLAIVITEAATNIVKHAVEGVILIRSLEHEGQAGIEIVAIDKGPGMENVALRMQDGHSTAGTYGVGMGAISRLSSEFDIYSSPGCGTALLMVLWATGAGSARPRWQLGAVCLPIGGEDVSGDAWDIGQSPGGLTIATADGLGHGPEAALASERAVEAIAAHAGSSAAALVTLAHEKLRGTRGAALAVSVIDADKGTLCFAGVGNIAGSILHDAGRNHLMSHNGIVGSNLRKVQEFVHPWSPGALLILHSDGLATRWDVDSYPGLRMRHPALVAAVLYRDFVRGRDDAMILVVREAES